ncbi:HEAT repeat domain-containing protein [Variovorax sp. J22P240]|uniref:HEAT repeat domain-containing protein n=1 Tax=Variovorax sp. J22P240 TaxID=3053514 RepID=UPI0025784D7D|nr:HEAT repeat domain-containing protein [Variovorax sp. J22P240]MDM0002784.1 HEAT repeat domain-containing protein [Variovorax sp. J22P240]
MPARKNPPRKTAAKTPAKSAAKKVAKHAPAASKGLALALDADAKPKARAAAAMRLGWSEVCGSKASFRSVLGLVRDAATPLGVRYAALSALQSATFGGSVFAPYRPEYLSALRTLRSDPDFELRQRVLGILARENDGDTQAMLLEGLQDPDKAMVPAEKALQLLSYDVHAGAFEVARQIAEDPSNALARREALRVLAADGGSAPMFENVLRSRAEPMEVRQIAAAALHQLAPERLQQCARDIALDESESDALRSLGLNALAHFGDAKTLSGDKALQDYVDGLQRKGEDTPDTLARVAAQYSKRVGG